MSPRLLPSLYRFLGLGVCAFALLIQTSSVYAAKRNYVFVHAGAMTGYGPARVIEEAVRQSGTDFYKGIYKASGISTGAIITGLLTAPVKAVNQPFSPTEVVNFYKLQGPQIFNFGTLVFGSPGQKGYFRSTLNAQLNNVLLSQTLKPLSLLSYRMSVGANGNDTSSIYEFNSEEAKNSTAHDTQLAEAIFASSNIPEIFGGPALVEFKDRQTSSFIDLGKKNPSFCDSTDYFYKQISRELDGSSDEALLFSLGTDYVLPCAVQETDPRIEIVRLQPNLSSYFGSARNQFLFGIPQVDILAAGTDARAFQAFEAGAQGVIRSPEFARFVEALRDANSNVQATASGTSLSAQAAPTTSSLDEAD